MVKNTDNFIMLLTGELYTDLMEIHMLELRKLCFSLVNCIRILWKSTCLN